MKLYTPNKEQVIYKNISDVFDFFSKPENLSIITPPKMNFNILTPSPIEMKEGALIDYTINIMFISMRWRTLITKYDPPYLFIDEQIKGPYIIWHHRHSFKDINGGTMIQDTVRYAVPLGIIGRFLNFIWIQKDLKDIFAYRKIIISNKLASKSDL